MSFASDVRTGLARRPRSLPPKYFYDDLGSSLFEAITRLPWYPISRAESRLLLRRAPSLAAKLASPVRVVELGSGSGAKGALVVRALVASGLDVSYHAIDLSEAALAATRVRLGEIPAVRVVTHRLSYEAGLAAAARRRPAGGSLLLLFLGSNIGNFDPPAAGALLGTIRRRLRPGDRLLLGADLVKPEKDLLLAYDDPLGVTAAFNRNVLLRMNRELLADFDPAGFSHLALFNRRESRIEMHLVSRRAQKVRIPKASLTIRLAKGERIFTESSYKYSRKSLARQVEPAGFAREDAWSDAGGGFLLSLFCAA